MSPWAAGVDVWPGHFNPPPGIQHHEPNTEAQDRPLSEAAGVTCHDFDGVKQSNPNTEAAQYIPHTQAENTRPRKKNAHRGTQGRRRKADLRATPCDPKLHTIHDEIEAEINADGRPASKPPRAARVNVRPGHFDPSPGIEHHKPNSEAQERPLSDASKVIFDDFNAVEQNNPHTQEADTSLATQMEDTPEEIPLTEHQLARLIEKSVNDWLNPITQA